MKTHPHADLFPNMTSTEFDMLKADIKANGCLVPVVVYDGMILDGRHRYRACKELGESYPIAHWTPKDGQSVVEYVVSLNLHRRQLNHAQRSSIAVKMKEAFAAEAKDQERLRKSKVTVASVPQSPVGKSRDRAAKAMGVSPRSVQDAEKVAKENPKAFVKMQKGEITVGQAKRPPPPAKKKSSGPPPARTKFDKAKAAEGPLKEIAKNCRDSRKLVKEIEGEPIAAHFNIPVALTDLKNLEHAAKWALPHAICPTCGGKRGCKNCKNVGWVPKSIYEQYESRPGLHADLGIVERAIQDQQRLQRLIEMTVQLTKGFNAIKQTGAAAFIDEQQVTQDIRMLGHRLRVGTAYTVCPRCKGKKCKDCRQQGWMNKNSFEGGGLDEFEREDHLKKYPPPKSTLKDE